MGSAAVQAAVVQVRRGHGLVAWAWVCVGLTPLALVGAAFMAFAMDGTYEEASLVGGMVGCLVGLAAPTAGFVLAFLAARRRERSARAAFSVASLFFVACAVILPTLVYSVLAFVFAGVVYVIGMFVVIVYTQSAARALDR